MSIRQDMARRRNWASHTIACAIAQVEMTIKATRESIRKTERNKIFLIQLNKVRVELYDLQCELTLINEEERNHHAKNISKEKSANSTSAKNTGISASCTSCTRPGSH